MIIFFMVVNKKNYVNDKIEISVILMVVMMVLVMII